MDLAEHKVSGKTIFNGKIVRLDVDQARLPDGSIATREVVYHPGGVAILALDDQNNVSLVKQFRYPFGKLLLELPAGKPNFWMARCMGLLSAWVSMRRWPHRSMHQLKISPVSPWASPRLATRWMVQ